MNKKKKPSKKNKSLDVHTAPDILESVEPAETMEVTNTEIHEKITKTTNVAESTTFLDVNESTVPEKTTKDTAVTEPDKTMNDNVVTESDNVTDDTELTENTKITEIEQEDMTEDRIEAGVVEKANVSNPEASEEEANESKLIFLYFL